MGLDLGASQLASELRDMVFNGDLGFELGGERRIESVTSVSYLK